MVNSASFGTIFGEDEPWIYLWEKIDDDVVERISSLYLGRQKNSAPLAEIASTLNTDIISKGLGPKISGKCYFDFESSRFKVEINRSENSRRQRFTVAHELGHILLHSDIVREGVVEDTIYYRSEMPGWKEVQANRIAASLLMPWKTLTEFVSNRTDWEDRYRYVTAIKNAFAVSEKAVLLRLDHE